MHDPPILCPLIRSSSILSFLQQRDISEEGELLRIQLSKESESERFSEERALLNEIVMKYADLPIKRFYSLDSQVYREGSLPAKTKQLLGLVASFVLRCDDCIRYHLIHCREKGVSDKELIEALAIGLVVGGSITIPHMRRAIRMWDEMKGTLKGDSRHKHTALKS